MTYKVVKELKSKGFPTSSKRYPYAHEEADKSEKNKYGKSYESMKKVDSKLKKGELAGKNYKDGKIAVSKKVPKKYRDEVAFHERKENEILTKRK